MSRDDLPVVALVDTGGEDTLLPAGEEDYLAILRTILSEQGLVEGESYSLREAYFDGNVENIRPLLLNLRQELGNRLQAIFALDSRVNRVARALNWGGDGTPRA